MIEEDGAQETEVAKEGIYIAYYLAPIFNITWLYILLSGFPCIFTWKQFRPSWIRPDKVAFKDS